jgi:hypothetical protein
MSEVTIPQAIEAITKAMLEDKSEGSYYYSWQANIAMSFVDEYQRWAEKYSVVNDHPIHSIANQAAKNFLDLLCAKPMTEGSKLEPVIEVVNESYNQAIDNAIELVKERATISLDDKAFYKKFNTYRYPYGAIISEFEALKKPLP